VSMCFTWKAGAANSGGCDIANNIPGVVSSCYCTRYDIKDAVVEKPPVAIC
jgi:hypothetical protein